MTNNVKFAFNVCGTRLAVCNSNEQDKIELVALNRIFRLAAESKTELICPVLPQVEPKFRLVISANLK